MHFEQKLFKLMFFYETMNVSGKMSELISVPNFDVRVRELKTL